VAQVADVIGGRQVKLNAVQQAEGEKKVPLEVKKDVKHTEGKTAGSKTAMTSITALQIAPSLFWVCENGHLASSWCARRPAELSSICCMPFRHLILIIYCGAPAALQLCRHCHTPPLCSLTFLCAM
jgi:hypothetical protein